MLTVFFFTTVEFLCHVEKNLLMLKLNSFS